MDGAALPEATVSVMQEAVCKRQMTQMYLPCGDHVPPLEALLHASSLEAKNQKRWQFRRR